MMGREFDIKEISAQFAKWKHQLSLLSSINLTDGNIVSEYTVKELLNTVYSYSLVDANVLKGNFPAVDLVDQKNRLAVQVTITASTNKIQKTIDSFLHNELDRSFDSLLIFVIGDKQRRYTLQVPGSLNFTPATNILDLKDLLKKINSLPTDKISRIRDFVSRENRLTQPSGTKDPGAAIREAMAMKEKFNSDFISVLPKEQWEYARYEPWIRFKYHNAILRDPGDKSFPVVADENNWLKVEFWDTYDQGVEFIAHGSQAVFDKEGHWDILSFDDLRKNISGYRIVPFFVFHRLAYANIAVYDLSPDDYYSSPTIYCHFNNGSPYEDIKFGTCGSFQAKRWQYLFDNSMRKTSGW